MPARRTRGWRGDRPSISVRPIQIIHTILRVDIPSIYECIMCLIELFNLSITVSMLPHTVLYLLVALILQPRNESASAFSSTSSECGKIRYSSNIKRRNGFDDVSFGYDDDLDLSYADVGHKSSHIVSIKSTNIAGMISEKEDANIQVDFGNDAGLVAITGESGTGKSLLVSKAIDLVTGGKAVSSLVVSSAGQNCDEERLSSVELSK